MSRDKPGKPAYKIFSIKRSFYYFKFWDPVFKQFSVWERQT